MSMATLAQHSEDKNESLFPLSSIAAVNIASVPQRSPLCYPGGKTWLIPHIREWLSRTTKPHPLIIEPFAGGSIVSLTAVMESFAERAFLADLDRDVAAFWRTVFDHNDELVDRIRRFDPTREQIERLARKTPRNVIDHGFRTLVLNRTRRGGVLAPGAALIRNGENGKGVASRWYPETLVRRLEKIAFHADRFTFIEGDGLCLMQDVASYRTDACFFIDPPYTARGGKKAGARLYFHNEVNHTLLFEVLANSRVNFLMTYDCSDEIVDLVETHKFHAATVMMKNGHHARMSELIITRDRLFT